MGMSFQVKCFSPKGKILRFRPIAGLLASFVAAGLQCFGQTPAVLQQPASQTVFYGDPATFQVVANGGAPLSYQWFKNDTAISGATANTLTLPAVGSGDHNAGFSARITNASGAVTSVVAMLTVDFGVPGAAITNRVLNYSSPWRYEQSNSLDSVSWYDPAFDALAWPVGPGLLGAENNAAIIGLIGTTLLAPTTPPPGLSAGHAYYFRTTVSWSNDQIAGPLIGNFRVDDGAVIYLNGSEVLRIRMTDGAITNLSFATEFPPGGSTDATTDEPFPLQASLSQGTNTIAVSVHQQNASSSDVVWGMTLDAVVYQRLRDTTSPILASLVPAAGSTVPTLTSLEVHFSEGVKGVNAGDLLINGIPATNLVVYGPDV